MFRFQNTFNISSKLFQSAYNQMLKLSVRYGSKGGHPQMKVTVLGAAGRTGQPLSLMLKQSPLIDDLALVDVSGTCGFGLELGHIDTKCKVSSYSSMDGLSDSLNGAKVVVLLAAASASNYKSCEDMFKMNASIVKDLTNAISKHCPSALLAIVTHPVNCMVPLASEVMKKNRTYNPNKIFGVTTLNVVRTNTFVGNVLGLEPECVSVSVLGGATDRTIVPVLSHARPCSDFSLPELELLTANVQMAHQEIVNIKKNEGSTLAAAFAIARFVTSLVKGLLGKPDIIECTYVRSTVHPYTKYLATPVQLGPGGIQRNLGIPDLSEYEKCLLEYAISEIKKDVQKAEKYMGVKDPDKCDVCSPDTRASPCPRDHCRKQSLYD